ncbi:MAG: CAF17-like 4Fe-4S cluster assembly/insertion protein YgfZ [Brevirhabdus sp.]
MAQERRVIEITGSDRIKFLQGLVSNNVQDGNKNLIYAALLTPQGKYLFDFFLKIEPDRVLLDVAADAALDLVKRLTLYKLRADVALAEADLHLHRGLGTPPEDARPDPRNPGLGWRAYRDHPQEGDITDWDALRVAHLVPQAGQELVAGDSYILEMGFERLNGVDFRKGCYVGQEVTARMKHKTELRKGLARVALDGTAEPGSAITREGKPVGTLHTVAGDTALAYLRFDRASPGMVAGEASVTLLD